MLHKHIKTLIAVCILSTAQLLCASEEYSNTVDTVQTYISEKYGNNQKIFVFFNKKLEKIINSSDSETKKIAELKKQFATAFANHEKSVEEVVTDLFRRAHLNNDAEAQHLLGYCYYFGIGVKKDFKEAAKWLNAAAQKGNDSTRFLLGICRFFGQGLDKDQHKAVEHFQCAADSGHHGAQLVMGVCYHEGIDVDREYYRSFKYLTKAAADGCMVAQRILANCYFLGDGIKKNESVAVKYYSKAANRGDTEACWRLGYCYQHGLGVKKSYKRAAALFQKSSDKGDQVGRNVMCGRRFFNFGAVKDSNQAILHSVSDEKDHFNKTLEHLRKH